MDITFTPFTVYLWMWKLYRRSVNTDWIINRVNTHGYYVYTIQSHCNATRQVDTSHNDWLQTVLGDRTARYPLFTISKRLANMYAKASRRVACGAAGIIPPYSPHLSIFGEWLFSNHPLSYPSNLLIHYLHPFISVCVLEQLTYL